MRKRDGDERRGTPQSRTKRRERARQKGATTQLHRARVLEVRIQSPPAESRANFRFLSGGAHVAAYREPLRVSAIAP